MSSALAIRNGRVLTADGFVETDLGVEAGSISRRVPDDPEVTIDASGLLIAPGYVDIQINGGYGLDFTADPTTIWEVGAQLPATGVACFVPTIITSPAAQRAAAFRVVAQGPPPGYRGARVLGLHFEGPMLADGYRGTHQQAHLRPPSPDLVDGWEKARGLRLVTLAPELAGAEPVIERLRAGGVVVAAGHSAATYEEGVTALRAGVRHGTHLPNGMPPLAPREPGLVGALLDHTDASVAVILDGVHLHPAAVRLIRHCKPADRMVLITDATAGMGAGPGAYALHDLVITVDETSARNTAGDLAGSILTLDQAVKNYVAFTGCAAEEALTAASANPARVIGEQTRGRIEVGSVADLVLLDEDLTVQGTLVEGNLVHGRRSFTDRIERRADIPRPRAE